MPETMFLNFKSSIDSYSLPENFTFPFYYKPHPLCELASEELQQYLATQTEWQHNFGINTDSQDATGKMFGVLLVQNKQSEIGYLAGFSGKLAEKNILPDFVPPVFDMLEEKGFFKRDLADITAINDKVNALQTEPKIKQLQQEYKALQAQSDIEIALHRVTMIEGRKSRKKKRLHAMETLLTADFMKVKEQLSKESILQKNQLRDLNLYWNEKVEFIRSPLTRFLDEMEMLKNQRKQLSSDLQNKLFDHYQFLNQTGTEKNLRELFQQTPQKIPPAGAGECAAPKLLHYAFQHGMKPLALAEFWWGISPTSEIRKHKHYYAACKGKCQPILTHMLEGIKMDDNPLLTNPALGKTIDIVYEDDVMVIINKPADFLSVPGKNIQDSVHLRMKIAYPFADSPLIVHRLDMSTSGLMVIALTKKAHKNLQKQFINRTVEKRYIALLNGNLKDDTGAINLPLRVDLDDRPRQLVCYDYGKNAETSWQVIERKNNTTKVFFYPKTGRTHQLRVHSAHIKGLNMPIVGDDLYGNKSSRLHLHAESLTLQHPDTRETLCFNVEADF